MTREIKLEAGNEYRFELPTAATTPPFTLKLESGSAEVFGTEMAPGREYTLPTGCKGGVFTWDGARLTANGGPPSVEYTSAESPAQYTALLNMTAALDTAPAAAQRAQRFLVVGSGRNTVTRILLNYQARRQRLGISSGAVHVDLDPATGSALFPGTLSLRYVTQQGDIEADGQATPNDTGPCSLMSLFYGSVAVGDNMKLFRRLTERLASWLNVRDSNANAKRENEEGSESGASAIAPVFITAPSDSLLNLQTGSSESTGASLLKHLIGTFGVDAVVVVGDERLFVTMAKHLEALETQPSETPLLLKIPKSGGIVEIDAASRRARQASRLHSYFYGPRGEYRPFTLQLSAAALTIYRLAGSSELAPSSALPLGAKRRVDELRLVRLEALNAAQLLYSVLGVVSAEGCAGNPEAEELPDAALHPIAGYVQVCEVDETLQTLTVLSPCPGALPSRFLLLGSIKWME